MSVRSIIQKHGVTIGKKTKASGSVDAIGGRVESFISDLSSIRSFVQITGGSDTTTGGRETRIRTARFYFDSSPQLDIEDRLVLDGAEWEIRSVTTPGEKQEKDGLFHIIIEAEEVLG